MTPPPAAPSPNNSPPPAAVGRFLPLFPPRLIEMVWPALREKSFFGPEGMWGEGPESKGESSVVTLSATR